MGRKKEIKIEDNVLKTPKIDTRYYDELFQKIKDQESEEFNDSESLDALYSTILDQIREDNSELKKCLYSYHIDYFLYQSSLEHFSTFFTILTSKNELLNELLSDTRTSRAYEACLMLIGNKIKTTGQDQVESLKNCMVNLGEYFVSNFENILETHNGIFSLRAFLRVIGNQDILETVPNETNKKKFKNQQFNIKNVCVKIVPNDWNLDNYIKKFSKFLKEMNLLEIGLDAELSPFISLLLRKLYTNYSDKCSSIIEKIHKQFVKKSNSFNSMIQDAKGSRFIESFLLASQSEMLTFYLNENILPNIVTYSKHIYANYPIQTLIKHRMHNEPAVSI